MRERVLIRQFHFPAASKQERRIYFSIRLPEDCAEVYALDATTNVKFSSGLGNGHVDACRIRLQAAGEMLCEIQVRHEGYETDFPHELVWLGTLNEIPVFRSGRKRKRLEISVPGHAGLITGYAVNNKEIATAYNVKLYLYYKAKEKP